MGIRVGIPCLKLSANAKPTKRKGDCRKVALESGRERYSKDQDLDRSRSHLNEYTGFDSGKKLADYWEAEAANHLDAKGRHLRSDAVTGFAVIVKPDMVGMSSMSEDRQVQFCRDARDVVVDILQSTGLQVDMTSLQRDEVVPHVHILGHDPEYKAGKKLDIRLYARFNREFPKRMRDMGYDVDDLTVYDPDKADDMTADEVEEYKADCIKHKHESGRSSNKFKADKLREESAELDAKRAALEARAAEIKSAETALAFQMQALQTRAKQVRDDEEKASEKIKNHNRLIANQLTDMSCKKALQESQLIAQREAAQKELQDQQEEFEQKLQDQQEAFEKKLQSQQKAFDDEMAKKRESFEHRAEDLRDAINDADDAYDAYKKGVKSRIHDAVSESVFGLAEDVCVMLSRIHWKDSSKSRELESHVYNCAYARSRGQKTVDDPDAKKALAHAKEAAKRFGIDYSSADDQTQTDCGLGD